MKRSERLRQVMKALDSPEPPTREEMADQMGVSHQYVSQLVDELEDMGFVRRRRNQPRTTRVLRANTKETPWTM